MLESHKLEIVKMLCKVNNSFFHLRKWSQQLCPTDILGAKFHCWADCWDVWRVMFQPDQDAELRSARLKMTKRAKFLFDLWKDHTVIRTHLMEKEEHSDTCFIQIPARVRETFFFLWVVYLSNKGLVAWGEGGSLWMMWHGFQRRGDHSPLTQY